MKRLLAIALIAAGCSGGAITPATSDVAPSIAPSAVPAPATRAVAGSLTVAGADMAMDGQRCTRLDNLPGSDVRDGDQVTLLDEDGTVLAIADLRTGATSFDPESRVVCFVQLTFTFSDVPDAKFYQVRIKKHDGPLVSLAQLQAADWQLVPLVLDQP